jgi:hypothetical protein
MSPRVRIVWEREPTSITIWKSATLRLKTIPVVAQEVTTLRSNTGRIFFPDTTNTHTTPRSPAAELTAALHLHAMNGACLNVASHHLSTATSSGILFNRLASDVGWIPNILAACVLLFPVAVSTSRM